jgi:stage II sporulation protein AB (anti-sigma F factor)
MKNTMEIKFKAIAENEAFARNVVASFLLPLNPSVNELEDIKTAVNEAVTNVIVHAYPDKIGYVNMKISIKNNNVQINIWDNGIGIDDVDRAKTPFYTTKPNEERSGMGFTVMESFMDKLEVTSKKDGLNVMMLKSIESNVVGL